MEDRFFLDGVDVFTDQSTITQPVEDATPIFSDLSYSPTVILYSAVVVA